MKQLLAALAASAALAAPAAAQNTYSYGSQPVFDRMQRDREIRGIVQEEIRYQRPTSGGGMPREYSPSGSCYYCDSLIK